MYLKINKNQIINKGNLKSKMNSRNEEIKYERK